jgi:hypothetical protein
MHAASLTSLSALKEIPAAAKRRSAPFPPIQSQTPASFFYFPFNKLCRPFISCIRGPC